MVCLKYIIVNTLYKGDNKDYYYHHHHMSVMELGHLLTRSGLTYLEVSSEVCHDSFCQLGNSVSLSWVVCHEAFCLHVVSSSSCIPVVCLATQTPSLRPTKFYTHKNMSPGLEVISQIMN